jgi:hypothetical protein
MRLREIITEFRQSLGQYLKQQFPTWPDYVVLDLMYPQAKGAKSQEELQEIISFIKQEYPVKQWRLETLPITLDIFNPETQKRLKERAGGSKNPYGVPRDTERHATQAAMIQKQGVRTEPIIVFRRSDGFELVEGWHRTIQHLQAYPNGYTGPAWVGYL